MTTLVCAIPQSTLFAPSLATGRKILVFLLGTLVLGAILAPVLFWCSQPLAGVPGLGFLKDTDFSRFFERGILLAAVLLAFPTVRWVGMHRFNELGVRWDWSRSWFLAAGFLVASIVVSLFGSVAFGLGLVTFKVHPPLNLTPNLLLTSLSVAAIEEPLFRGVIFGLFRQTMPTGVAASVVSVIFSVIHPLKPGLNEITQVTWHSGFDLLCQTLRHFADPWELACSSLPIFVLGLLLAHATVKTGSLWLPIGVHAGVVFTKMSFNKFTRHLNDLRPWFGSDLSGGLGAIATLLLLWLLLWLLFRGVSRTQYNRSNGT